MSEAGSLLVGDAAEDHGHAHPEWYWSGFKLELSQRPLHLGPRAVSTVDLAGELMRVLRDEADRQTASRTAAAVLGFPPRYVEHSRRLLLDACREAGFAQVSLVAEPIATVTYHAWLQHGPRPGSDGEILLVYDLGGGGLSAAVVLRSGTGRPEVLDHVASPNTSGTCFDRVIYQYVARQLSARDDCAVASLTPGSEDPRSHRAQVELLAACRQAKEALSQDRAYTMELSSFGLGAEPVRLEPGELEQLLRPLVLESVRDCRELFTRAAIPPKSVAAVIVTGGGARIPWVGPLVADCLGLPLRTVEDPELAVSAGLAIHAAQADTGRGPREIVPLGALRRQGAAPTAGAFAPAGASLASGLWGRKITFNSYPEGEVIRSIDVGELWLSALALTADGRLMATAGTGRRISVWSIEDGDLVESLEGHTDRVCGLAFANDPIVLISASDDGTVQAWDLADGRATRVFTTGGRPCGCAVGAGGQWVATAVGSAITGWPLHVDGGGFTFRTPHDGGITDLAVNGSGTVIAAAGMDGNVSVWDPRSGSPLHVIEAHQGPVRCVDFGSGLLATGGADAAIRVWDAQTGDLRNTLTEHTSALRFLSFDSSGLRLASGSADGTVQLWRIVSE